MYSAWKRQKWFTETMWQNSNKYYMKWSILHWLKTLSALQLNRAFDLCISVVNERCVPRSTRPNVCIKYVLLGRDNCRLTMTGRLESTSDACEEGPFPFSSDHKTTSSLFSCFSVLLTQSRCTMINSLTYTRIIASLVFGRKSWAHFMFTLYWNANSCCLYLPSWEVSW